ncbi:TIGR02647 family protein [Amphritea sp. 1_MG-2023]|uniref:TIGR02647 family protein n=1 Tax=Amphritea sp. 1_MG-2023 TaxID=3062670 RepID=UPI0026E467C4|nr:TIGR02647 family protein [Amphritea sp. 1_MG-2023]MDO6562940.1 TIGR02647 family protein [Amphritea sp. 1_MG-2023]
MPCTTDNQEEINMLIRFSQSSDHQGLKVHKDVAAQATVDATQRLFDKQLITLFDGGYLTPLGHEAADHAHALMNILNSPK